MNVPADTMSYARIGGLLLITAITASSDKPNYTGLLFYIGWQVIWVLYKLESR